MRQAGLYGVASRDPSARSLTAEMAYPGKSLGDVYLGSHSRVQQDLKDVTLSTDGQYIVALFGELFFGEGGTRLNSGSLDAFILTFTRDPAGSLRECDGAFALAVASQSGDLWVATDHFGTFAVHIRRSEALLSFATQMRTLGASQVEIEPVGVLQSLALGMTVNGTTSFRGISRLANATLLHRSSNGSVELTKYYRPDYASKTEDTTRTLEAIRETLTDGVSRRVAGFRPMAALTGGLDSRATWAMILGGTAARPTAHTHGLSDAHDLEVARRIAHELRLPHDEFELPEQFNDVASMWQETATLCEGVISVALSFLLPVYSHVLSLAPSAFLDSYGGAFYRRQRMRIPELRIKRDRDLIPQILQYELSPLVKSDLLDPQTRASAVSAARDALAEYYASIEHVTDLGDKLDLFHFEQVDVMKDSALTALEMNFHPVQHPLMNHRAISLAAQLPAKVRRTDMIPRYIIHNSYPALEQFALDNVGFPSPYSGSEFTRYAPIALERAANRVGRYIPRLAALLQLRKPTFNLASQIRPGYEYLRSRLLDSNSVVAPLVDRSALIRALDRSQQGNYSDANSLLQLLTLDLSLRSQ